MRQVKLTKEEQWIEDHLHEFKPVSKQDFDRIASAIAAKRKDSVLTIRINSYDLENIKKRAKKLGIKYQTFITEILHQVAKA